MSGMSAPSVLIMSMASGDRESESERERKGERSMNKKTAKEKWLTECRRTKRARCLIVWVLLQNVFSRIYCFSKHRW